MDDGAAVQADDFACEIGIQMDGVPVTGHLGVPARVGLDELLGMSQ